MTSRILFSSPLGIVAFTPDELAEAMNRAKELVQAVVSDVGPSPSITPGSRWLTPKEMAEHTRWLSVDEVAQRSGLRKSWIYEQVRSDNIPHRHFGKQVRIPASYLVESDTRSGANGQGGQ